MDNYRTTTVLFNSRVFASLDPILEVFEHFTANFQKLVESRLVAHVLVQVGQEEGEVEADLLGRIVELIDKGLVVELVIFISYYALHHVFYFFWRIAFYEVIITDL